MAMLTRISDASLKLHPVTKTSSEATRIIEARQIDASTSSLRQS